jgi:hypothetical protein
MEMERMTAIAGLLLQIRDKKAAINAEAEARIGKLNEMEEKLTTELLAGNSPKAGVMSVRTSAGTLSFSYKPRVNVADWEAFYGFIRDNNRFDFLHRRVSDGTVAEYVASTEEKLPPPGSLLTQIRVVTVKRPPETGQ